MRIISGRFKRYTLTPIPNNIKLIRPTSDYTRECIFNILHSMHAENLKSDNFMTGKYVLDMFAGAGTLGLEAISRGAQHVHFVDISSLSCNLITRNINKLGVHNHATVSSMDALKFDVYNKSKKVNYVFIDPPYSSGLINSALDSIHQKRLLSDNALIICEHGVKDELISHSAFELVFSKKHRKTHLLFLRYTNDDI